MIGVSVTSSTSESQTFFEWINVFQSQCLNVLLMAETTSCSLRFSFSICTPWIQRFSMPSTIQNLIHIVCHVFQSIQSFYNHIQTFILHDQAHVKSTHHKRSHWNRMFLRSKKNLNIARSSISSYLSLQIFLNFLP